MFLIYIESKELEIAKVHYRMIFGLSIFSCVKVKTNCTKEYTKFHIYFDKEMYKEHLRLGQRIQKRKGKGLKSVQM